MNFMNRMDKSFDLFAHHKTDCLFEIMFLGTLPKYGGRGIGKYLCEYSIKLAKELSDGKRFEILPNHLKCSRPTAVISFFTSKYTRKIGDLLNFKVHVTLDYSIFEFNGKTFAERIMDSSQSTVTIASLIL